MGVGERKKGDRAITFLLSARLFGGHQCSALCLRPLDSLFVLLPGNLGLFVHTTSIMNNVSTLLRAKNYTSL
jgi:hypothetical protein